jgi:hypothetical protein
VRVGARAPSRILPSTRAEPTGHAGGQRPRPLTTNRTDTHGVIRQEEDDDGETHP